MASSSVQNNWVCRRCNHESKTKGNLVSHLKRKQPCSDEFDTISITDYLSELTKKVIEGKVHCCQYCDTKFSSRQAKYKHKFICNNTTKDLPDTAVKIASLEEQNKFLQDRIANLEKQVINVGSSNTQINHTTNINNNTNQFNISFSINSFGSEDVSYLTPEFLSYCLLNPRKGLTSLIENIHYNTDYPENQNIRCKSLKQNIFEKYVNSEWRACDASNTLDELIKKGYRIMNAHYTDNFMNDPELLVDELRQQAYERFRFLSDTNCQDYFAVKREVRLLVKDRTMYLIAPPEEVLQLNLCK
jgi:hypothetical protein